MKEICQLKPEDLNCNIFSCYDYDGLSLQELLCQFYTRINECIEVSNYALHLTDWLVNEGLSQEVAKKLQEWLDDGTISDIINKELFGELNAKVMKKVFFFETKEAMEESTALIETGASIITQGYYRSNDGGGAEYIKKPDGRFEMVVRNNTINVKQFGIQGNGTNETDKFQEVFNFVKNGYTIIIPEGTYKISRIIMEDKEGITIKNGGIFSPLDNEVALIGLLSFRRMKNCILDNLRFNGNKEKVLPNPKQPYGYQSLLYFYDCENMITNNLYIENTKESGFTSDGNIKNILFNNSILKDIGEHGFYLGGTNCNGITFNKLRCYTTGLDEANYNRITAVIKFRNKKMPEGPGNDIKHDNVSINDFYYTCKEIPDVKTGYRTFIYGDDIRRLTITNGQVEGKLVSLFHTNSRIDSILVENVNADCNKLFYGVENKTKLDPTVGEMKIQFKNCKIQASIVHLLNVNLFENCYIAPGQYSGPFVSTLDSIYEKHDHIFRNCVIDLKNVAKRINVDNLKKKLIFIDTKFINKSKSNKGPIIELSESCENGHLEFNNVEVGECNNIIKCFAKLDTLKIVNSDVRGPIASYATIKNLILENVQVSEKLYRIPSENKILSKIYLKGQRTDAGRKNIKGRPDWTSYIVDLRPYVYSEVGIEDLMITGSGLESYKIEVEKNIPSLFRIKTVPQGTDVVVDWICR